MSGAHFPPAPPWARDFVSVGVTGTNGKTTTTRWVAAALSRFAPPVACVTTVGSFIDDTAVGATEDYEGFLDVLGRCRARGGRFAALECTSEALALGFAAAWPIKIGVFTNLSHDHLDAHRSFEHYLASKAQLFLHLAPGGAAVLNAYDDATPLLREVIAARTDLRVLTYGAPGRGDATAATEVDLCATAVEVTWKGTTITLAASSELSLPSTITVRAIGAIYAENALAALGAAICSGVPSSIAAAAIEGREPPVVRFEVVAEEPWVVVDYAHTPDALARTLAIARGLARRDLVVVFGAGGNRDRSKRHAMGEAARIADRIVLTSDNPRDEDPAVIAAAIGEGLAGHSRVDIVLDRASAIRGAIREASKDDVIVVAGKGHERTQTIAGATTAMSDRELAIEAHRVRERPSMR
ncbi:UDP-N-acetylmuramoyl-L-alanyl-D-glutamate--2,6-diaminopimelate ligase [soil metagenome]